MKKLTLKKEVVATLNDNRMKQVLGGAFTEFNCSAITACPNQCLTIFKTENNEATCKDCV